MLVPVAVVITSRPAGADTYPSLQSVPAALNVTESLEYGLSRGYLIARHRGTFAHARCPPKTLPAARVAGDDRKLRLCSM